MMSVRPRLAVTSLALVIAMMSTPGGSATAAEAPPTLSGEIFRVHDSGGMTHSTGHCEQTGESTFSFTYSGTAAGPYPGTFTETGTVVMGAQTLSDTGPVPDPGGSDFGYVQGSRNFSTGLLLNVTVQFEIDSPVGQVTGTKTLAISDDTGRGVCAVIESGPIVIGPGEGSGDFRYARATLEYDALIESASGRYRDSGSAFLSMEEGRFFLDTGGGIAVSNFVEAFTSTRSATELIAPQLPSSTGDCKEDGWQQYGVFGNQGDCVSFVATDGGNPPSGG